MLFFVSKISESGIIKKNKAQVSVISIVLITGILVALSGTAYMWGVPIIEKNTAVTELQTAENFITKLNEKIMDVSNTGAGEETLEIPIGFITVVPNKTIIDNNSIILEFLVRQSLIWTESDIYLGGSSQRNVLSETGVYGEALPSVITMKGEKVGDGTKIRVKLHYRDLVSKNKKYKITLNDNGNRQSGNSRITISFDRTETEREADYDFIITHIKVIAA